MTNDLPDSSMASEVPQRDHRQGPAEAAKPSERRSQRNIGRLLNGSGACGWTTNRRNSDPSAWRPHGAVCGRKHKLLRCCRRRCPAGRRREVTYRQPIALTVRRQAVAGVGKAASLQADASMAEVSAARRRGGVMGETRALLAVNGDAFASVARPPSASTRCPSKREPSITDLQALRRTLLRSQA